jgi:hypothetical protein
MPIIDTPIPDHFPAELIQLSTTASDVLNTHLSDQGCCVICNSLWPCERAPLAEHNLAAL